MRSAVLQPGPSNVTALPKMTAGRPLLLGKDLDSSVQAYITALRKVGGVVNTTVVIGAAEGIVSAKNPGLLAKHGGHIEITKSWVQSLFQRMGYVKRKGSNAGKVTVTHFEEAKEIFLVDIVAEVIMNDIPSQLIFNWDQTAIHYVSTGQWTMHKAGEKIIPIANSDDKRQITAVLAVTMNGDYFPPQSIYQGKTTRCHPAVSFPNEWDVLHSDNHWSNEETMLRYIQKIIVPYISQARKDLDLPIIFPSLAIFDCFRGQTTPKIIDLLEQNNIRVVQVPAHCTDKLQPIDVSLNKPVKDEMRRQFHEWYAHEVQTQLQNDIPIEDIKVDMPTSILKNQSANWIINTWSELSKHPELAINGFDKVGILPAIKEV